MQLTLSDASGRQILQKLLEGVYSYKETITGSAMIDPSSVQVWWPNEMGSQSLYNAKVDIVPGRSRHGSGSGRRSVPGSSILASAERRVGFRTIVLTRLFSV